MKAAKFVIGLVTAAAVAVSTVYGPETTVGHVITIVLALAGALGVYLVPNAPAVTPPASDPVRRTYG